MAITLTPEQERLVSKAVETGAYETPDAVIDRALQALRSQDEWLQENKEEINAKIERAVAQMDQGAGITEDELREHLANRKSAWLASHQH